MTILCHLKQLLMRLLVAPGFQVKTALIINLRDAIVTLLISDTLYD